MDQKTMRSRYTAGIMASMMLVVVLLSACFMITESEHQHIHEEECPICIAIEACRESFRRSAYVPIHIFAGLLVCMTTAAEGPRQIQRLTPRTLVSQKVRIDD